jgi:hypothetical protein
LEVIWKKVLKKWLFNNMTMYKQTSFLIMGAILVAAIVTVTLYNVNVANAQANMTAHANMTATHANMTATHANMTAHTNTTASK